MLSFVWTIRTGSTAVGITNITAFSTYGADKADHHGNKQKELEHHVCKELLVCLFSMFQDNKKMKK
jgi:hypothetical protein